MRQDFWVFAYGSLMWDPGFVPKESVIATLYGWHRAMCIRSTRYRGTPSSPGLVLGLDRGGSCRGIAFRVGAEHVDDVRRRLHEREMIGNVYVPRQASLRLTDGRRVDGSFYTARRESPAYAGALAAAEAARIIRATSGSRGTARDYLANTVARLAHLGLDDPALTRLLRLVDAPDGA